MKIIIDKGADELESSANNYVIVILPFDETTERHVKITYEGIFEELVSIKSGRVLADAAMRHEDILDDL